MIYTQWGNQVRITAYHGKHKPKWANAPMMLVTVSDVHGGDERFQFAASLRADDGINEIEAAIDAAPEIGLSSKKATVAIRQAE